jgi:TonB family protein
VSTPITFGVRNPLIILPRDFARTAESETIQAVIAHEKGHWQRHDYAWNLALQFLTAPIRFHPAVMGAMRQLAAMRELAADELAAASTPRYAERLVDAARLLSQTPEPSAVGLGLFDCDRLEERVMKLTNPKPALSTWTARILTTAITMALTVGAVAMSNYTAFAQAPDKVGPNVTAPKLIYKVEPSYEDSARTDKVSGTVLLSLVVTKEGIADQITVKRSLDPRLDERAIIAVKQWRFKPGQKNGEDTNVLAMIEVNFRLE